MAKPEGGVTIIKRKRGGGGDGHHGGAWKVAYADFVTAMMAFFLLLWLLNATTEDQRKGIADYFSPTVPLSKESGGGSGLFSGDEVFAEDVLAQNEAGSNDKQPSVERQARGPTGSESAEVRAEPNDSEAMAEIENLFLGMSGESERADELLSHVITKVTDEGLIIDLFSKPGAPLFGPDGKTPTTRMQALLTMIGGVAALLTNEIAVSGFAAGDGAADLWERSGARAQGARRGLIAAGVTRDRLNRVTGKADRDLAAPDDPASPRNQRVEIVILRPVPGQ